MTVEPGVGFRVEIAVFTAIAVPLPSGAVFQPLKVQLVLVKPLACVLVRLTSTSICEATVPVTGCSVVPFPS